MLGLVNLQPGRYVYLMSATMRQPKSRRLADKYEAMMERIQPNFCQQRKPQTAQAYCLRQALPVYPLRQ